MGIGTNQIILVLLVAAVIFGASKLPQIGEGMGKAIRNFKKSMNEPDDVEDITPRKEISQDDKNKKEA